MLNKRRRYTTGAMCFMLFVWLGGMPGVTSGDAPGIKSGEM